MIEQRPLPRLGDYAGHARRIWRRLAVLGLIGALIGTVIFVTRPKEFRVTSRVALSPQVSYLALGTVEQNQPVVTVDTIAALLSSDEATGDIAKAMRLSARKVPGRLDISAKPVSRVLIIRVTSQTRKGAIAGNQAAVAALLRLQAEKFAIDPERVQFLRTRVNLLNLAIQDRILAGSATQNTADALEVVQVRLNQAIETNNTSSQIITEPQVSTIRPGEPVVYLFGGLSLGILLGLLSAGSVARTSARRPAAWQLP
jgi:hypothetical protein